MESKFAVILDNTLAKIELCGRLDANNAGQLQEELKKLVGTAVNRIVFMAKDLEYISSAGLRVIIFAKQKIGSHASVYLVGAQEAVVGVVKMSGLDNFMYIQETFSE